MKISRRNVLLGATAAAALAPLGARAQASEVVIGVLYPMSGASAQIGVDAQKAFETAADTINNTKQSTNAVTVSQICERYGVPFLSADNSSPSLHRRGLKFYFRAAPHDEMYSAAMFEFFDAMKKKGTKIETLSLFQKNTNNSTDSGGARAGGAGGRGGGGGAGGGERAGAPARAAEV